MHCVPRNECEPVFFKWNIAITMMIMMTFYENETLQHTELLQAQNFHFYTLRFHADLKVRITLYNITSNAT